MMKAAVFRKFGGAEVLEIADIESPRPGDDEVLVKVRAAAVNPKDTFIRKGRFTLFTGKRLPQQVGFDFAGEVCGIGKRVSAFREGAPVFGMLNGWHGRTCAEFVAVKQDQMAAKPESLSYEEAAALPLAASTALQALRDKAHIQAGFQVCINGASGGVGTMAVQIAKYCGASITAIGSAANHELLKNLGAGTCVDYRDIDIAESNDRFDIFFDVFGNQGFKRIAPVLSRKGIWVSTVPKPRVFGSMLATRVSGGKRPRWSWSNRAMRISL